jgi:hypothetical protein
MMVKDVYKKTSPAPMMQEKPDLGNPIKFGCILK